jgi:hypothetical protein
VPLSIFVILRLTVAPVLCDDAFINLRIADNLAEGRGMVFNPGERVYVTTAPLWTALLALGRWITGSAVAAASFMAILFNLLFLGSVIHLGRLLWGRLRVGVLAAALIALNPAFYLTSVSGMELPLYLTAITVTLSLLARDRYRAALLMAAVAVWIRFDGWLLYVVVAGWILWLTLRTTRRIDLLRLIAPSVLVLAAHTLFGWLTFGDVVPMGLQAKAALNPAPFTEAWVEGATRVAVQFGRVVQGRSAYWYMADTPLVVLFVPLAIGLVLVIKERVRRAWPLLIYTTVYVLSMVGSGNAYARHFPWYFVPALPGAYLVAAWALDRLDAALLERWRPGLRRAARVGQAAIGVGLAILIIVGPLNRDAVWLRSFADGREVTYAAVSTWLSDHLAPDPEVAANEIGAVGYVARPDVTVLDLFGIARRREDRSLTDIELVKRHGPAAVLTLRTSENRPRLQAATADGYRWLSFRTVTIGLRADVEPALSGHRGELDTIYRHLRATPAGR